MHLNRTKYQICPSYSENQKTMEYGRRLLDTSYAYEKSYEHEGQLAQAI